MLLNVVFAGSAVSATTAVKAATMEAPAAVESSTGEGTAGRANTAGATGRIGAGDSSMIEAAERAGVHASRRAARVKSTTGSEAACRETPHMSRMSESPRAARGPEVAEGRAV